MVVFFKKKVPLILVLVAVFLLSVSSSALAGKVALSHTNGRIMPASVFVVGTYDEKGRPDIALIDRAGIASAVGAEKVLVYVSVNPSRHTAKNISETGSFTINIPSDGYIRQVDFAGSVSAKSGDLYINKFATTGLTAVRGKIVNAPMVKEFPVSMECRVLKTKSFGEGSHTMYIAEVLSVWIEESVLNPAGTSASGYPNPQKVKQIIYYPGSGEGYGYYSLGNKIGSPESYYKNKYPDGLK